MSDRDEVKAKLDIVEVIREYIPVKATGANFQALCPFHNEKTPSFSISPDKQIWHCFGCGRGGDIFSFIMEKEGLNFIEALRLLASKAGVVLKNENQADRSKRNRLLDIMDLAGKYYAHILSSVSGQAAKAYLIDRGLTEEVISDWQLGCSPDAWSSLYEFLLSRPKLGKKYNDEEIAAAGLIIRKEGSAGGRQYYDRFRDRIMFPIRDVNGNLVAFTARVNPAKEQTEKLGKYINSPQTEIYDKSRILFGLNKAKEEIRKSDSAIVVEGQMDAIACHNHGFTNVVASSGTALTAEQVVLIKRFTNNVALAFDMDAAGQTAADRGIKEVLAQSMNVKVITLPQGKDPADCLRQNPDDFRQAALKAQPMLEYYFQKIAAGLDLNQLDNKMIVRDKMFAMIALVPSKSDQGYWLKRLSEELDFVETDIREEFSRRPLPKNSSSLGEKEKIEPNISPALPGLTREQLLSELFLALIIRFPELINYSLASLEPELLQAEENSGFYKILIIYYNKAASFAYNDFRFFLEEKGAEELGRLDRLILLGEKEFYSHATEQTREALLKIIMELKRYDCQKKIKSLEKSLAILEKEGQGDGSAAEMERLMRELKAATEELKKLI